MTRILTDQQIELQVESIVFFLRTVHPFLMGENSEKACAEIRPIPRRKDYSYTYNQSLSLWSLDERSIERLRGFIRKHTEYGSCLYYSVYAFDHDRVSFLKSGKKARKGRINSDNALFTQEIVLDFDDYQEKEYLDAVDRFRNIGLEGVWVHSGHGYQVHFLLKRRIYDTALLGRMVDLFDGLGFDCDVSCRDAARLMRLPSTYNYKCLTIEKYREERDSPPMSRIVRMTAEKYSAEDIIARLSEHLNPDEDKGISKTPTEKKKLPDKKRQPKKEKTAESVPARDESAVLKKISYPYISHYNIPEPICKMLSHVPEGLRNKALGFLIRYLKTYMKLSRSQMDEILTLWCETACQPRYDEQEFREDFSRMYYYNGLNYDSSLAQKYGYIDFEDQNVIVRQFIFVPADFLKRMSTIDGNAVRTYLALRMLEHLEKETTIDDIAEILKMTTRAVRPTLKKLLDDRQIYVIKGNRRLKEPNRYFSTKIVDLSQGYLKLSFNDIKAYVDELSVGELKLYLFMSWRFFDGKCFMSQKNIGRNIGLEQNTISELIKGLQDKYFIRVEKTPLGESRTGFFLYSCVYTLLR